MNTNVKNQTEKPSIPTWALQGLAVVGFITLIIAGILLAIYTSRFVPTAINKLDSATVSLSHIFIPARTKSTLSVVPNISTKVPTNALSTGTVTATKTAVPISKKRKATQPEKQTHIKRRPLVTPTAGKRTTHTYAIGDAASTPILHGLPDLTTHITAVGYLTSTSTNSFLATSTIPAHSRVAVKFTITNIGTNVTGPWNFSASIPTQINYIFNSPTETSLNPSDHIDYVLAFDQANAGSNQTISITANPKHSIVESNWKNNSASASVTVLGN